MSVLDDLASASGVPVLAPGTSGYDDALGRVFFPAAARRRPLGVVAPRSADEVAAVLKAATATATRVTVRGGGLSSNCVADDAVVLDLSTNLGGARPAGERVVVGGGARVSTMLDALAPAGRAVPVGIVGHAGLGLVTRGGVGYLSGRWASRSTTSSRSSSCSRPGTWCASPMRAPVRQPTCGGPCGARRPPSGW